jgi:hypothetical protein
MNAHSRSAGVREAIERLEVGTRAWRALEPTSAAAIEPVVAQADAVARGLRELRQALHVEQNRTPSAAA